MVHHIPARHGQPHLLNITHYGVGQQRRIVLAGTGAARLSGHGSEHRR